MDKFVIQVKTIEEKQPVNLKTEKRLLTLPAKK